MSASFGKNFNQAVSKNLDQKDFLQRRLEAVRQASTTAESTCTLFIVLRDWHEQTFVHGLMAFLKSLDELPRQKWLANFTKTRILAGDPQRNSVRSLLHCGNQDVGFALVDSSMRHDPLSSLLVDFQSAMVVGEGVQADVVLAGGADIWQLYLDVRELNLQAYIVHLTHLLAESFILLEGRTPACLRMTHLNEAPQPADAVYARIEVNEGDLQCRGSVVLERT